MSRLDNKRMLLNAVLVGLCSASTGLAAAVTTPHQLIATELNEVRSGTLNGREYLTVRIRGSVGPSNCRGDTLRIDTAALPRFEGQEGIETVALSAMLNDEVVMIRVPMAPGQCLDGKPTITDMYVVPANP